MLCQMSQTSALPVKIWMRLSQASLVLRLPRGVAAAALLRAACSHERALSPGGLQARRRVGCPRLLQDGYWERLPRDYV